MATRWTAPLAIFLVLLAASCSRAPATGKNDEAATVSSSAVPLATFLRQVRAASYGDYAGRPGAAVQSRPAFDEMRSFILTRYHGQQAARSFTSHGAVFDCIRASATTPPPPPVSAPAPAAGSPAPTGAPATQAQAANCPQGSVPVRRITLGELVRFPTLQHFLGKSPGGSGQLPPIP